jgi:hypothetical protein
MCYALENFFNRLIHFLVDMWNVFVFVPWTTCSAGPCSWWCLCCNKWLCWIALILVAVLTILFWVLMAVVITILVIICEILCMFGGIGRDAPSNCFGNGNPDPGPGPYPTPTFPTPPVNPEPPTKPE